MKKLIEIGNAYIETMDTKEIVILKICLVALGVAIGISLPKNWKRAVPVSDVADFCGDLRAADGQIYTLCEKELF